MSANDIFISANAFSTRLRELRASRRDKKLAMRQVIRSRRSLAASERKTILEKTDSKCHICGGEIFDSWDADHLFSHSLGGIHSVSNYLPAHPICNNYRWFYGTEEFQWIIKLGVWLRTRIEKRERIGLEAASLFVRYEQRRHERHACNGKGKRSAGSVKKLPAMQQKVARQ